jgi:hypothetical protein
MGTGGTCTQRQQVQQHSKHQHAVHNEQRQEDSSGALHLLFNYN